MKSKKTDAWIVSHELTHHLFQHEPNVFKAILDEMEAQNPITNEQIEKYRKRIHNGDKLSRADIVEEMVADAMFDVVKQTNLLKGIATKNPTMAERIIEVLNSIVQKLKDLVYTPLGLSARQGKALENAVFRLAGELKDGNGNRLFSKKGGYLSSVRTNLALDDNIVTDTVEDKDGNVAYVNNIMDNLFGKVRFSLGRGNGYHGFSKSNNAIYAEDEGKFPASVAAKKLGVKTGAVKHLMTPSEWHHTGKMYNKTDYYDVANLLAYQEGGRKALEESLDKAEIDEVENLYKQLKEYKEPAKDEKLYRADVEYLTWGGTRSHPTAEKHTYKNIPVREKGSFYTFTLPNGTTVRKKIDSNGTRVAKLPDVAEIREREQSYRDTLSKAGEQTRAFAKENADYELSMSGTVYPQGKKPTRAYRDNPSEFFQKGDCILREDGRTAVLQEWDGNDWVTVETSKGVTPSAIMYAESQIRLLDEGEDKTKGETAAERLARDEEAFGKLVDTYIASDKTEWKEKKNGALFRVMDMPLVLQMLGAPDMTLSIYGSGFEHILSTQRHPGMHESILKQLPSQLADPIMVVADNGKYVAVIELKDNNGATIVVPVEINKKDDQHGVISVVNTMFGKDRAVKNDGNIVYKPKYEWFERKIKSKDVLYANKKKSTRWMQAIWNQSPVGLTLLNSALSDSSIKHESDLVKLKNEFPTKYSLFKTKNKSNLHKRKQLELLLSVNPMIDDYHVGIRSVGDIVDVDKAFGTDFEELYPDFTKDMAQEAQKTGKIKVYSSKPIKVGGFVSPSRMCAKDYAGNGKIYSKDVAIEDVAWIDSSEGEYAPVDTAVEQPIKYSLFKDSSENVPHSTRLRKIIEKGTGVKIAWGHTKDTVNVYYDDEQGVIRSRDANNFRVVMPKVAEVYCSLLDVGIQKVGDKRILDPAMRNYVTDYLMTGAGNRANTKEAKAFEAAMKKNIEIAENIVELRAEFERYNQMSDAEKAMEAIKYDTRKPITAKRLYAKKALVGRKPSGKSSLRDLRYSTVLY